MPFRSRGGRRTSRHPGFRTAQVVDKRISIRPAAPGDLAVIGQLGELLVRTHHEFDPKRFIAATSRTADGYGSFLGTQLDEPNVIVLVAEANDEVIGYAYAGVEGNDYMSLRGPAGVLYDIVVDPAHRRQGVGRMLLDAALNALKERGAPRVVLSTADQNSSAQRLFDGAGFRRTMIEMTRELSD
ncbi:MAG: N-acetyltransferase family protein [Gemmatimonadaceae bacterium]